MRSPHRFRQTYSAPGIGGTLSSIDASSPALVRMMDNCINVPYNLRWAQLGFPLRFRRMSHTIFATPNTMAACDFKLLLLNGLEAFFVLRPVPTYSQRVVGKRYIPVNSQNAFRLVIALR